MTIEVIPGLKELWTDRNGIPTLLNHHTKGARIMCDPCSVEMLDYTIQKDMQYVGSNGIVDNLIKDFLQDQDINGCGLGIVVGNEIVYLRGYGKRDGAFMDWTKGTRSMVGSISKTLTALGIFVLAEEGQLGLDDTIAYHLPFNVANLGGMTIRELLTHTSGITHLDPEFGGVPDLGFYPVDEEDLQEIYPNIEHPGSHPSLAYATYAYHIKTSVSAAEDGKYSNVNYSLLGAIIDEITKQADYSGPHGYETFITQKVCFPAEMHATCLTPHWRQGTLIGLAKGFSSSDKTFPWPSSVWGWEEPSGGWSMTIGDLARLMIAINTNKIISPTSREEMMTFQGKAKFEFAGHPQLIQFGHGVHLFGDFLAEGNVLGEIEGYMHHGNFPGFTARYTYFAAGNGVGVALLTNKEGVDQDAIGILTQEIVDVYSVSEPILDFSDEDRQTQQSAVYRVATEYGDQIRKITKLLEYKAGNNNDLFTHWVKFLLSIDRERGRKFLHHYYGADYEKAAEVALEIFEYRGRKRVEPLPEDRV
jgi:CubicO group peptidase (beta-lactamase class C family)